MKLTFMLMKYKEIKKGIRLEKKEKKLHWSSIHWEKKKNFKISYLIKDWTKRTNMIKKH